MTDVLSLYNYAESRNIEIDCFSLMYAQCISVVDQKGSVIVIDPYQIKSSADEKAKLAHEIGHHETRAENGIRENPQSC